MRHLKKRGKLRGNAEQRRAMFRNMMVSFFQNGNVKTTLPKAKELRRLSERIITRARDNTLHNKRLVLGKLQNRSVVAKLFDEIGPKFKNIPGGYTRIIKLGKRTGDGAELSILELREPEGK